MVVYYNNYCYYCYCDCFTDITSCTYQTDMESEVHTHQYYPGANWHRHAQTHIHIIPYLSMVDFPY